MVFLVLLISSALWGGYRRFLVPEPEEEEVVAPLIGSVADPIASPLSSIAGEMTLEQEEDKIRNVLDNNVDDVVKLIEKWMQEEKEEVSV